MTPRIHKPRVDLTGQRFGRWLVLRPVRALYWLCKCDCGNEREVFHGSLRRGASTRCMSCHEGGKKRRTHGGSREPLFAVWCTMIARCTNPNNRAWPRYGGRGIVVCREWLDSYEAFRSWCHKNGYARGLTVDRTDTNGPYSPSNCRFATYTQQNRNRRDNRLVVFNGESRRLAELAAEYGHTSATIRRRLVQLGWPIERALSTPLGGGK